MQIAPGGFNILPPVVKNLLIINGLFFLATIALDNSFGINLYKIFGLHFVGATDFSPYQFLTYMFMHGSFSHLFFNMFALWMFGNMIENYWGPRRFLFYYLATGFGAAIIHYLVVYLQMQPTLQIMDALIAQPNNEGIVSFLSSSNFKVISHEIANNFELFRQEYNLLLNTDPQMALTSATAFLSQYRIDFLNGHLVVGASGSVFGILLAFGMIFPNALIYLFFAIPIRAKYLVILYGLLELIAGIADRPGSNIAHFAHLGGMIFGLILILYWRKKRKFFK